MAVASVETQNDLEKEEKDSTIPNQNGIPTLLFQS